MMKLQAGITALAVGVGLFALACDGASDALLEPPGPSFSSGPGPVVESATGSGMRFYLHPGDPGLPISRRTFTFNAKKHADGSVDGQVQLVIHDKAYPEEDWIPAVAAFAKASGKITCLTVIGKKAWMGGYFTHGRWIPPQTPDKWVFFYAEDNGQGANAPADVLSFIAVGWDQGTAEEFCALAPEDWLQTFEIEAGNIKVNG